MEQPYNLYLIGKEQKLVGTYKNYKCANRKLRELRRKGVKCDILIVPYYYITD
jgi:hypothetical protein